MSFDLRPLEQAVKAHGTVCRVVVAQTHGSIPRETGASMLVWATGQSGTIGGGALEYQAAERAREALHAGDWLERISLGPAMGQCCGGAVTLLAEVFDAARLNTVTEPGFARPVSGNQPMPIKIKKLLKNARNSGKMIKPTLSNGWMIEAISRPTRQIWIHGAGHVGRAVVAVLGPCPDLEITWTDSARTRFPQAIPDGVNILFAKNPADLVRFAPAEAEHLIFTYSHPLDLEICHRLLNHGFHSAGLIGSKTKWARFRGQLRKLGHSDATISSITCPIGQPELGKHPQAVAIGVAATILSPVAGLNKQEQTPGRYHERTITGR